MSVNFKLPGNVLVSKDSIKSFCNILAVVSELILSILGGILSLVDDLLGFMSLTHYSPVSHFYTTLKRQKIKGFLTFSECIEM